MPPVTSTEGEGKLRLTFGKSRVKMGRLLVYWKQHNNGDFVSIFAFIQK